MTNGNLLVSPTIDLKGSLCKEDEGKVHCHRMILETHLAAFVSFANVVYIPFAMVMVFTRHNGIHATGFAFKCSRGGRISSTALDLVYEDVNLSVSKRQKTKPTGWISKPNL